MESIQSKLREMRLSTAEKFFVHDENGLCSVMIPQDMVKCIGGDTATVPQRLQLGLGKDTGYFYVVQFGIDRKSKEFVQKVRALYDQMGMFGLFFEDKEERNFIQIKIRTIEAAQIFKEALCQICKETQACKISPKVMNPLLLKDERVTSYLKKLATDNGFKGVRISQEGVSGPAGIAEEFVRALEGGAFDLHLPLCVV